MNVECKEGVKIKRNVIVCLAISWNECRTGACKRNIFRCFADLVLGRAGSKSVDFQSEPWNSASLVTPRHAVWRLWNEAAVPKKCRDSESGEHIYICTAEDHIRNRELTLAERYNVAACAKTEKRRKCKDLPWRIELSKGMKILVTDNVEMDLDVTNGAQGEIVNIILQPDEPPPGDKPTIYLKYVPSYILVKLNRTWASQLDRLDESAIPVEVATTTMKLKVQTGAGKVPEPCGADSSPSRQHMHSRTTIHKGRQYRMFSSTLLPLHKVLLTCSTFTLHCHEA